MDMSLVRRYSPVGRSTPSLRSGQGDAREESEYGALPEVSLSSPGDTPSRGAAAASCGSDDVTVGGLGATLRAWQPLSDQESAYDDLSQVSSLTAGSDPTAEYCGVDSSLDYGALSASLPSSTDSSMLFWSQDSSNRAGGAGGSLGAERTLPQTPLNVRGPTGTLRPGSLSSPVNRRMSVSASRLGVATTEGIARLFVDAFEKDVQLQTTATVDAPIAAIRLKIMLKLGIPENNPSWKLYLAGVPLSDDRTLHDYNFRLSGEHIWCRQTEPYVPTIKDLATFEGKHPPTKKDDVSLSMKRFFADMHVSVKVALSPKSRGKITNLIRWAISEAQLHDPTFPDRQRVDTRFVVYPLSSIAKPKNRPLGVEPWRLEVYLSEVEFRQVFGMDREDFYRLPPHQRWALKAKCKLDL